FIEIDSSMETIVIGKRNIAQTPSARAVDPRLQEFGRIRLNAMSLRMGMVIAENFHGGSAAPRAMLRLPGFADIYNIEVRAGLALRTTRSTFSTYGSVRNFCRT